MPGKQNFVSIQLLRGIAVLLVVVLHAGEASYRAVSQSGWFTVGHAGVDIFFVISGFVITLAHRRDLGVPNRVPNFFYRRFIRIYPPYWIVSLGVLAMAFLKPGTVGAEKLTIGAITESFSLLPLGRLPGLPILPVGWTLFHEVIFYAIFGLAILLPVSRHLRAIGFVLWMSLTALGLFTPWLDQAPRVLQLVLSPFNLEFSAGCLIALLMPNLSLGEGLRKAILAATCILAAALLAAYIAGWTGHSLPWRILIFGGAGVLLVAGCATGDAFVSHLLLQKQGSWIGRPFQIIGDASYSIYLVHFPVIALLEKIRPGANILVYILPSVAAGAAFYYLAERPLLRLLRRRKKEPVS